MSNRSEQTANESSRLPAGEEKMYKLPRSVQVVVHIDATAGRRYLLLRRLPRFGGFWQAVTGSLEAGETHHSAAIREVREETGIVCVEKDLVDLGLVNVFEIAAAWRHRYAPGVTRNEEVCFALRAEATEITLDPKEHDCYVWTDFLTAMGLVYWHSNKLAIGATQKVAR
jgi:dATP pyrophosphohydrolase